MPWTMKDHPPSLKNFDKITRRKIIDIANAMVADGYEEERAIPIAIAKGKEWAETATTEDAEKLQQKNITYHPTDPSSGARLQDRDVEVRYREDERMWEVRSKGAKSADSLHRTKREAQQRAAEITRYRKGKVISYKKSES